jgi:hypothetical protein
MASGASSLPRSRWLDATATRVGMGQFLASQPRLIPVGGCGGWLGSPSGIGQPGPLPLRMPDSRLPALGPWWATPRGSRVPSAPWRRSDRSPPRLVGLTLGATSPTALESSAAVASPWRSSAAWSRGGCRLASGGGARAAPANDRAGSPGGGARRRRRSGMGCRPRLVDGQGAP